MEKLYDFPLTFAYIICIPCIYENYLGFLLYSSYFALSSQFSILFYFKEEKFSDKGNSNFSNQTTKKRRKIDFGF